MKVSVSVGGRFWAFELAEQLQRRGYLEQLITAYPRHLAVQYKIPKDCVETIIIKEILERGWGKLPPSIRQLGNPQFLISEVFDRLAARRIKQADIVVGWSNFSEHTFKRAHELGALTVLERGSSHMLTQQALLSKEYERWKLQGELAHPLIVQKELREYEATDYICVPSKFVERTFLERGFPAKRLLRVPFGVNLSAFAPKAKTDNCFRVVFVGAMSLRKGIPYLLQAFTELNLPNSELLLIGRKLPEIEPFFRRYAGHYRWLGVQPQAALAHHYSQGSVFVLMSIEEGLAMVLAQAMACGLPVICTPNTGGEDIVRDGIDGFIVPNRDVIALKEKLTYLYEESEARERMSQAAQERVRTGFSWDDYGRRLIEAYEKILQK